jgi:hypothetical protein
MNYVDDDDDDGVQIPDSFNVLKILTPLGFEATTIYAQAIDVNT